MNHRINKAIRPVINYWLNRGEPSVERYYALEAASYYVSLRNYSYTHTHEPVNVWMFEASRIPANRAKYDFYL